MVPVYVLLAFAGWTLGLLTVTVGVYRWSRILTGRSEVASWQATGFEHQGDDFYRRAMRAHLNCVENLPVLASIVLGIVALGAAGPWYDALSVAVIAGRVLQSTVHVAVPQTNLWATLRFAFYLVQVLAMLAMLVLLALEAATGRIGG